MERRVVKLGGSLLSDGAWIACFRQWLGLQPPMASVLIVGGGAVADVIREWSREYRLFEEVAHWLAIDAMSITARLAAGLLPEANWTDSGQDLSRNKDCADLTIFDPRRWLHDDEPSAEGERLSVGWDTTSDSIAARVAQVMNCSELVLLKSCRPLEQCASLGDLASQGYVDANFPRHAAEVPVRCVNLRDTGFAEWRPSVTPSDAGIATSPAKASPRR
jgi:aspartokinase-like uncharacterized kinase